MKLKKSQVKLQTFYFFIYFSSKFSPMTSNECKKRQSNKLKLENIVVFSPCGIALISLFVVFKAELQEADLNCPLTKTQQVPEMLKQSDLEAILSLWLPILL